MGKSRPYYVAIDSDVLRALVFADILLKNKTDFRSVDDFAIKQYGGYLRKILKYMHEDKLRIVILNNVYQENKHSPSLVSFIVENCYVPNITFENYGKIARSVSTLAKKYCRPYFDQKRGKQMEAPMLATYDANVRADVPTNDAFHMAEATIAGVSIVTLNGQHFVFNKKEEEEIHNSRSKGIQRINIREGYYQQYDDGRIISPKPFTLSVFGPLLKGIEDNSLAISEVLEEADMIRAKDIKEDITAGIYDTKTI